MSSTELRGFTSLWALRAHLFSDG